MAEETKEATEEKAETESTEEAKANESAEESKENGSTETKETTEELKDKHGQPAISAEKYEREVKERDQKIADLQAKLDASAETKEGREALKKEIDSLKADMAEKDVDHALDLAGCKNKKAAKALLEDHEGDVQKLKEAEPYLFNSEKKTGSTGFKPEGAASGDIDSVLDKAFAL